MPQNDNRNTLAFLAIAFLLLIAYQFFILDPQAKKAADQKKREAEAAAKVSPAAPKVPRAVSRETAKASVARVPIETGSLTGSISLQGARIDDLFLTERKADGSYRYAETLKRGSPAVELLRPAGVDHSWFVEFGWEGGQNFVGAPDADTVWTAQPGARLTPKTPLVLTWRSPAGLVFTRTISVDEQYMFTVQDVVANLGAAPVTLSPYAAIKRESFAGIGAASQGSRFGRKNAYTHEGAVGVLADADEGFRLRQRNYRDWKKKSEDPLKFASTGGWMGITDKYWLAALVPDQKEKVSTGFLFETEDGRETYDARYIAADRVIQPGRQITETTRLFAGPKVVQTLQGYEKDLSIPNFDKAIDWGMLWFFSRPFFQALEYIFGLVKNFGLAILAVTLIVRLLLFPLAQKSYESMSRMKKLQKPMEEIRARYKDDPTKMQQETMALYQREKVNPLAGCLPLLLQIPIFLAFYKVLSVTIEMRHAPFFGYVQDLSAPDPHTILNLFGLIPWDVASTPLIGGVDALVHLGPLPLLYGFTMWLTTAMNPPAPDPMQQRVFQLMPIFFTFIMAGFPAGLLIYWTFSNVFSIFQQYFLMHRMGTENPIDDFIARVRGTARAEG